MTKDRVQSKINLNRIMSDGIPSAAVTQKSRRKLDRNHRTLLEMIIPAASILESLSFALFIIPDI